jgi:hypothetical protein
MTMAPEVLSESLAGPFDTKLRAIFFKVGLTQLQNDTKSVTLTLLIRYPYQNHE